MFHSRN